MYDEGHSLYSFVDHYWRMVAEEDGMYPQSASVQWGLLFIKDNKKITVRLVGPRTRPIAIAYKKGQRYWGIVFHGYVGLADMSKIEILNKNITIPMVNKTDFQLGTKRFQIPQYEEFDIFVDELLKYNILTDNQPTLTHSSVRTKQRQFKQTTGLTPKQIEQANRVTAALDLLGQDLSLADVAMQTGFADQAHMTREFKVLVGQTPAQIRDYYK